MADKIVVLQGGRIEQIGSPLELYDKPANAFVASFIGSPSMNLIPAIGTGDGARIGDAVLAVPGVAANRSVTLGMRPEDLTLSDAGLPATVSVVEPTGSETHIVARLGDRDVTAVTRDRPSVRPGETIHLAPVPGRVHLFDAESGARL